MIELDRSSNAAHWTWQQYAARITDEELSAAQHFALVALDAFGSAQGIVAPDSPPVIAFLVASRIDKEWEVENIVVAERVRRRGIGFCLATRLVEHVRHENDRSIFLEVRESNRSARMLYRKLGFQEVGRRTGYYANPPEDAIICCMTL